MIIEHIPLSLSYWATFTPQGWGKRGGLAAARPSAGGNKISISFYITFTDYLKHSTSGKNPTFAFTFFLKLLKPLVGETMSHFHFSLPVFHVHIFPLSLLTRYENSDPAGGITINLKRTNKFVSWQTMNWRKHEQCLQWGISRWEFLTPTLPRLRKEWLGPSCEGDSFDFDSWRPIIGLTFFCRQNDVWTLLAAAVGGERRGESTKIFTIWSITFNQKTRIFC